MSDIKTAIFIGQLVREKGADILITCFFEIAKRIPNSALIVVGEGPLRESLQAKVRDMGMSERVFFMGLRNDTECLLRVADVLVCPSIWKEAFGLCNAEAMATGVPVVASRIGGIPEVVKDGDTGYLFEPRELKSLITNLLSILTNEPLRANLGEKALKVAKSVFSLEKMASQYKSLYLSL